MLLAAFLTTGLVVGAVSAFHVLKDRAKGEVTGWTESRIALVMAVGLELGMLLTPYPQTFGIQVTPRFIGEVAATAVRHAANTSARCAGFASRWSPRLRWVDTSLTRHSGRSTLTSEPRRRCAVASATSGNCSTMRVVRDGEDITLTARELALLELFMTSPGRVLSRERILSNVWGVDEDPLTNVVDVFVGRLRSKVDPAEGPSYITTLRGLGYRLEPPARARPSEA